MPAATPAEVRTSPSSMKDDVRVDLDLREEFLEAFGVGPVRGGGAAVEETGGGEDVDAGADGGEAGAGADVGQGGGEFGVRTPSSKTGPSSYDAGTITVSAVARASGPFGTWMAKSASVSTGPGGRTEQVTTS